MKCAKILVNEIVKNKKEYYVTAGEASDVKNIKPNESRLELELLKASVMGGYRDHQELELLKAFVVEGNYDHQVDIPKDKCNAFVKASEAL